MDKKTTKTKETKKETNSKPPQGKATRGLTVKTMKEIKIKSLQHNGTKQNYQEHKISNPELPEIVGDENVEKALYNRAVGMLIPETIETEIEGKGKITKITFKCEKPDVSACIFWLKNRLPEKWKETKSDIEEKESFRDFIEKFGPELVKEIEGKKKTI